MSFCGKKYRRVRCENVEELLKASKGNRNALSATQGTPLCNSCPGTNRGVCSTWRSDADVSENIIRLLQLSTPIFFFTRTDETSFQLTIRMEEHEKIFNFKLGEETEIERRDGSKVKIVYTLEGDNILKEVIKQPDGKIAHFIRDFSEKESKMTITVEGIDVVAVIYYEVVE
ncbi:uncharacterized protein ACR2FA_006717 [Aphomia sociella]